MYTCLDLSVMSYIVVIVPNRKTKWERATKFKGQSTGSPHQASQEPDPGGLTEIPSSLRTVGSHWDLVF